MCNNHSWLQSWCIAGYAAPFRNSIPYGMQPESSSTIMGSVPVPPIHTLQLICCMRRCVGTARVGYLTATHVPQICATTYRVGAQPLPPKLQSHWLVHTCLGLSTDQRRANPCATTTRGCKVGASLAMPLLSGTAYRRACTRRIPGFFFNHHGISAHTHLATDLMHETVCRYR